MSEYPHISTGLGEFSPALWARWIKMLRWYEENNIDQQDIGNMHRRLENLENRNDWFFAKLLRAKVLDTTLNNPNAFEYAWVRVYPEPGTPGYSPDPRLPADNPTILYQGHFLWKEDMKLTSWGENVPVAWTGSVLNPYHADNPYSEPCVLGTVNAPCHTTPYTAPGINIMEAHNTGEHASPGTDETKGIGDFMMQAIGGGDTVLDYPIVHDNVCNADPFVPCTQLEFPLWTQPIVMMWIDRETDGTTRFLFQAENAYDGTCAECLPD